MSDEFRIGNDPEGLLVLDQPRLRSDGWLEEYRLRLISTHMNAETTVENAPYGESLVGFFEDLNNNWKGWEGEKRWRAIEDEYRLFASMSKTGHVTLTVRINLNHYRWEATAKFDIEAGQLETLMREAKRFLKQ